VLPVLNGLSHMNRLNDAFGRDRVWGGMARIVAGLTPEGVVRQTGAMTELVFGEQDDRMDGHAAALAEALGRGPALESVVVPDILQRMWDKLVIIGTLAGATVLLRSAVGDIVRPGAAYRREQRTEQSPRLPRGDSPPPARAQRGRRDRRRGRAPGATRAARAVLIAWH
jgi:ketopantoate reductase